MADYGRDGCLNHSPQRLHHIQDRYRVLEKLGSGTYGKVVLAEELQTGSRVALKVGVLFSFLLL